MESDQSPPVGRANDTAEVSALTRRIEIELDRYREYGKFLRYAGTGSAIFGGAASLLPLSVGAIFALPFLGLGVAGIALVKQKERDEHIYHWANRLTAILVSSDSDAREDQLAALLKEILVANGNAIQPASSAAG